MRPAVQIDEQIELAVAAQLVRLRLVPDGLRRHDRRRLFAMLDAAAQALARVATLYVRDEASGKLREIGAWELQGAMMCDGGNILLMKDGRRLGGVSIRRRDLSDAIALLQTIGVPELTEPPRKR
jgi:hypothetical protein